MANYDTVAQLVLREVPAPYPGIITDVLEYPEFPGWLFLTLYAYNLAEFSDPQIHSIAEWLQAVLTRLNEHPLIDAKFSWRIDQREGE